MVGDPRPTEGLGGERGYGGGKREGECARGGNGVYKRVCKVGVGKGGVNVCANRWVCNCA